MNKRSTIFSILLIGVVGLMSVSAQTNPNLEVGFKPFGSYDEGSFDTVNTANGNLTISYPLINYPQRGPSQKVALKMYYNNKGWAVRQTCNLQTGNCTDKWQWNYSTSNFPAPSGSVVLFLSTGQTSATWKIVQGPLGNVYLYSGLTEDGATHQLAPKNTGGGLESVDATGIYYGGYPTYAPTTQSVIDKHGLKNLQDTNGNFINYTGTPLTDTIGRPLSPSGVVTSDFTGCPANTTSGNITNYPGLNAGNISIKKCYAVIALQSNFHVFSSMDGVWVTEGTATPTFLVGVVMYNGSSWATSPAWSFQYDSRNSGDSPSINYGDLTKVTLPTGGSISYTWGNRTLCGHSITPSSRAVASRTVDDSTNGTSPKIWTYGGATTDPLGNDTVHTFTALNASCSWYETQTKFYQGSQTTGTLLKTVNTDYRFRANPYDAFSDGSTTVIDVSPIRVTTTLPNGQVSKVETDFDATMSVNAYGTSFGATTGNVIEKREYDGSTLLRKTDENYSTANSNYVSANLLDLVTQDTIYDGGGVKIAQTTNTYDGTTLQTSGITMNHNSVANPGFRGNLTLVQKWLNTTGGLLTTSQTKYYDTGVPYQSTDPKGNVTTYSYDPLYYGAYPTQTQYPNTGPGNTVTHIIKGTYDFNAGVLKSFTDQNNRVSNYGYDALSRLTSASYPDSGSITFDYTDAVPVQIQKTVKISASVNKVTNTVFDGLGRLNQTQLTSDSDGTDYEETTYDGLGRVYTKTNPHRLASAPTDGTTSYAYDALGRTTQVTHPDSSTVLTTYTGRASDTKDEGNGVQRVERVSQVDALGRLASVCEVTSTTELGAGGTPGACGQDIAKTGFLTTYGYDMLDNLKSVTQGSLPLRSFVYDSLSRLQTASNPESGQTSYVYDANFNLFTRTRPAPNQTNPATTVTTTYAYDSLNRVTGITYSDTTAAVTNVYDQSSAGGFTLNNGIGRLTTESRATSPGISQAIFSYDTMGRITNQWQCTPVNCGTTTLPMAYSYDLAGNITSLNNGAGLTLTYGPYSGANRLTLVTSNLSDANHPPTLLSSIQYNSLGQPLADTVGNLTYEHYAYNNRGWMNSFLACSVSGSGCTGPQTIYSFNMLPTTGSGFAPNGNILYASDSANSTWTYTYDDLNRLKTGVATDGRGCSWDYDRYGNRWHQNTNAGSCFTSLQSFTGNNNRIDGYSYDAAGNLLNDGVHGYTYDAENRIIQVSGGTATYVYDARGRRVSKTSAAGTFDYLYDTSGQQIGDVSSAGWHRGEVYANGRHLATYRIGTTFFNFADWLGTERVRTAVAGTGCETITSLPFGDGEVNSGPCADAGPMHFTGKERDVESGLDMFGARYYGSSLGRFIVPDWATKPTAVPYAHYGNPQSLNLYSYVQNNPTTMGDPDGHCTDPFSCGVEFAGIGTLIEPGGGTAVGAVVGGVVGGAIAYFGGKAIVDQIHRSDDTANKNTAPTSSQTQSQAQSTPANPNHGEGGGDKNKADSSKEGAQDKKLSSTEVKNLEENTGKGAHEIKEDALGTDKGLSKFDLYKNGDGDIVVKPKGSGGAGEPTGYTTEHLKTPEFEQD